METNRFTLDGSNRVLIPGSVLEQKLSPDELIDITVRLRSRSGDLRPKADALAQLPLRDRKYIPRETFDQDFGADPDDVLAVVGIAKQNGLEVALSPNSSRTIAIQVPAGRVGDLFGSDLGLYVLPDHTTYRGREGNISFPPLLPLTVGRSIQGVFGLDNRRQAMPFISWIESIATITPNTFPASYDFPSQLDGAGQCIGVLEFGGAFSEQEIRNTFEVGTSEIKAITIGNVTGHGFDLSLEVALDLAILSQVAPKAKIAYYFAAATEKGWVDALDAAIHDNVNKPSVLSISWGWPERDPQWTQSALDAVDELLAEAALLGITVCIASGDKGPYLDQLHRPQALFPASSGYGLTCGGTMLWQQQEVTWNSGNGASGGGVSEKMPRPTWQPRMTLLKTGGLPDVNYDGRLFPDVAGLANRLYAAVSGSAQSTSGTSAAAPLWAALVACANQKLQALGKKPAGFITPLLYQASFSGIFNDVLAGSSGSPGYRAGPKWDACTGWGTPKGREFVAALLASAAPVQM